MAQYKNQQEKTYATDEAGMLKDAKLFAKRDSAIVELVMKELAPDVTTDAIADALIAIKLTQIKAVRLNRNTKYDQS